MPFPAITNTRQAAPKPKGGNAFTIFVHGAGGNEFLRRHGRKANISMSNDCKLLGDLYQELCEEDRSYFKELAKGSTAHGRLFSRTVRFNQALHSTGHNSVDSTKRPNLQNNQNNVQNRGDVINRANDSPSSSASSSPTSSNLFSRFNVDMYKLQFISIYNHVYLTDIVTNAKSVHPAEIAVISFSLRKGVFEKETIRVKFGIRNEFHELVSNLEFFNGGPNEYIEEKYHTQYDRNSLRAAYIANSGCSFKEALEWLSTKLFSKPGVVNVVDPSSDTMGTIQHMFQVSASFKQQKQLRAAKFYSFEDLTRMILDVYYPTADYARDISFYFKKRHAYNRDQIYCWEHKDPEGSVDGYYWCPVFCALSKIQMFFDFCSDLRVCGFSRSSSNPCYIFFDEVISNVDSLGGSPDAHGTSSAISSNCEMIVAPEDCDPQENFAMRFKVMTDAEWNSL